MMTLTIERTKNGWSKAELARRAHMHPAQVGQIESGRFIPYPKQLRKLAAALEFEGMPLDLLEEVRDGQI